ncbi:MAG: response regulator [Planctomycetes bacterium]|nr:response regulator [Planctomycetota bacterium]
MGKRILIVDDSPSVRQQVAQALGGSGYELLEAGDGQEALACIESTADLSLVLCDVNMPRMNGLELLDKLHEQGRLPKLPVLMLTTEGQPALMQRAKQAGAMGWIVKPFKPPLLAAAVQKLAAAGPS